MPGYELANHSEDEEGPPREGKGIAFSLLCCIGIFLVALLSAEAVAWARQASCDREAGGEDQWNSVIPAKTTTQMQLGFLTSWLWHQVDVYNHNATGEPMIGYWSNLDLFFGLLRRLG